MITTPSVLAALWLCATGLASLGAQRGDSVHVDKTFFTRRDAAYSLIALGGSAVVSAFDVRIAKWARQPSVQGDQSRQDLVHSLTVINEQPLTIAAAATYAIGRVTGAPVIADVGLHATEALVLTVGFSELIRGPMGRDRPRISPTDQYSFKLGKGFSDFGARSYPSIHAAAAFATAAVLTSEVRERNSNAAWVVGPVLYTAALIPPLSRIYLDQHWASDIIAGAFLGALLGNKVVTYAHSHQRSKLDRWLLGTTIAPNGRGSVLLTKSASGLSF